MWKNIVQPDRLQKTTWGMRISRCIPKATNSYSQYVILISFPLKQWLHKRTSVLCYMQVACRKILLLLMYKYRLPQFAECRSSISKRVHLINSFENSFFRIMYILVLVKKKIDWTRHLNLYYRYSTMFLWEGGRDQIFVNNPYESKLYSGRN
jgi:hypothetical protein